MEEEIRKLLFKLMCLFLKKKKTLEALGVASPPKDQEKGEICWSTYRIPALLRRVCLP